MRIYSENGLCALLSGVLPVVLVCGIVPLSHICRALGAAVAALAVRLVLEVISEDSIVVGILLSQPCDRVLPVVPGYLGFGEVTCSHTVAVLGSGLIVPEVVVMAGVV